MVETTGRNPEQVMPCLNDTGVMDIHKYTCVRHSLKAKSINCHAVSGSGFTWGDHPGEDDIPTMTLLEGAADALEIPLKASGEMAVAHSPIAHLIMGADGMIVETRLVAASVQPSPNGQIEVFG